MRMKNWAGLAGVLAGVLAAVVVAGTALGDFGKDNIIEMALVHEQDLAKGLGMLMPDTNRYVVHRGLVPLPAVTNANTFTAYFLNGLTPAEDFGFTVWPVSAVVSVTNGHTYFYNADGLPVESVFCGGSYSPDWIARLWFGDGAPLPDPLDPVWLPSKVESRWTFVAPGDMVAYAAARLDTAYTNAPSGGGASAARFGVPGIRVSEFRVSAGGFSFGLRGEDVAAFPHPAFHVLYSADLAARDWRPVARELLGGGAPFALPFGAVPGAGPSAQPAQHAPGCVQTVTTVPSPTFGAGTGIFWPPVTHTHTNCSCGAGQGAGARGFFALVSDVDAAGCGVPDWWLNLHGVNPADVWNAIPGDSGMTYIDMFISGLSPNAPLPWPPPGGTLALPFYVCGDYAAWEMTVKGLGPLDWKAYRVATTAPGYDASRTLALYRGNAYNISLRWTDSYNTGQYWYCWGAAVDGKPGVKTFNDYNPVRLPGVATTITGDGYVINNAGGLLTGHVHMNDTYGGNVAGGLSAMLYVLEDGEEPVEIGFRRADGTPAATLPVSKWEGAFHLVNNQVEFKSPNFIDADPDRFQVYVKDRRRTEESIMCSLFDTVQEPNNWHPIYLYRQPDGTYLSTNRVIVADSADSYGVALLAAGAESGVWSWMTRRALGGQVQTSYSYDGVFVSDPVTVGKDIKTLTVDVASMFVSGMTWAQTGRIENDMQMMQEHFAQADIKVNYELPDYPFDAPIYVTVAPTNWSACIRYRNGEFRLTTPAQFVIDTSGLGTNNVRVIYVPGKIKVRDFMLDETHFVAGYAFTADVFSNVDDRAYLDTCFVSARYDVPIGTPTHEVIHLLGEEHDEDMWNIMYPKMTPWDDLRGAKRLKQEQVDRIRVDKRKKLK